MQTDPLVPAGRANQVIIKKKRKRKEKKRSCCIVNFVNSADHAVKIKERKKRHKYLDLESCEKVKGAFLPIVIDALETGPKSWERQMEVLKNRRTNRDYPKQQHCLDRPKYSDKYWKLEVCQMLVGKNRKEWNINNNNNNNTNMNPAPVLENDTHKLQWDFNIQTDHLIPARRPDLIIIKKKKKNL